MKLEDAIKQSSFQNPHHKLVVNLMYTSSWLDVLHQQLMKPYGLTMQQYNVLRILRGQKGNPLSVNDLIARMIDKSSNASRLVDKLVEKELVVRRSCPSDRRQVDVSITPKGLELLQEIDGPIKSLQNTVAGLSEEEATLMNELLDKLRATANQHIDNQHTNNK
jgi:DNA-binding MarR family transcriptional regulator